MVQWQSCRPYAHERSAAGRISKGGHLGDVKRKRVIIGSIYPEKLTFGGFRYRTTRVNEAVELIFALDLGFTQNETGQTKEVFDLPSVVGLPGLSPAPPSSGSPLIHPTVHYPSDRSAKLSGHLLPGVDVSRTISS